MTDKNDTPIEHWGLSHLRKGYKEMNTEELIYEVEKLQSQLKAEKMKGYTIERFLMGELQSFWRD